MPATSTRRFPSLVDAVIEIKKEVNGEITDTYAATLRTDAAVILESLVAEFSEEVVAAALQNQGVAADAYRSTLRALAEAARARRPERRGS